MSLRRARDWMLDNSVLLLAGTVFALIWANLDWTSYHDMVHHEYEGLYSLHFLVTDVGMAFFFGIAAKEIREAMLPGGSLSSIRSAATPLVATLGGILGPAGLYVAGSYIFDWSLVGGWGTPCATDIAFAMMAARFLYGRKAPTVDFLLLLAVADDAATLAIIAVFYPTKAVSLPWLLGVAAAILICLWMRKRGFKKFGYYVFIGGGMSWISLHFAGLHPSLALVPIVWTMPHAKRDEGMFMEDHSDDTLNAFEHKCKTPVEGILFLFGLTNAGVVLSSFGTATGLVTFGLLLGKPLGIVLFTVLGIRLLKLSMPKDMGMRDLLVAGVLAGMGFTVAIFVATVAFPAGFAQDSAKMGALISFVAAVLGVAMAKVLGVGRFKRKTGKQVFVASSAIIA